MQIRQFERLQILVNEAVDQLLKIKLDNKNLHQQISELKTQIEKSSNKNNGNLTEEIERLKSENSALQEKHQVISSRLKKVLVKVKNLSEGVES